MVLFLRCPWPNGPNYQPHLTKLVPRDRRRITRYLKALATQGPFVLQLLYMPEAGYFKDVAAATEISSFMQRLFNPGELWNEIESMRRGSALRVPGCF